jgi:D-alanyl-D-alanine dipeptidase
MEVIGDYLHGSQQLLILEKDGKLMALAQFPGLRYTALAPRAGDFFALTGAARSSEGILFLRDAQHAVVAARMAGAVFLRQPEQSPANGFRIELRKPLDQLRSEALASHPPRGGAGPHSPPDLVDLTTVVPAVRIDMPYATANNFMGAPMYSEARAFLEAPAAAALAEAARRLQPLGYGLLVYDAYRPWYVTKMFWDGTPPGKRIFVADPWNGSRHNRGCAVDLTLYDLRTGNAVSMTSGFDEMSERAYPTYPGGTSLERWHRDLLHEAMRESGFTVNPYEWWHFDFKGWRSYPILNIRFEDLSNK